MITWLKTRMKECQLTSCTHVTFPCNSVWHIWLEFDLCIMTLGCFLQLSTQVEWSFSRFGVKEVKVVVSLWICTFNTFSYLIGDLYNCFPWAERSSEASPFTPVSVGVLLAILERERGLELTETEREGMRGAGKKQGQRGNVFNMTSKYLITSAAMSSSQTRLLFFTHTPALGLWACPDVPSCLLCALLELTAHEMWYRKRIYMWLDKQKLHHGSQQEKMAIAV